MAGGMLVFDEESGLAYEGYNSETMRVMCVMNHYTDLDVSDYDTADGRYALHDILESTGALKQILELVEDDLLEVESIYHSLRVAAQRTFEHTHSLKYMAQKSLGGLLTGEDITESIAKASAINNKMVEMLGALGREKAAKPSIGGNVMQFAKKK
ncbi:MAG: hypothetical protein Q4D04_14955 [Clostridia bacterium]|nr:hypothetical protein [Clostridia bacterium]